MAIDVLLVSLGATPGLRRADAELAGALRRAGASTEVVTAARPRALPTMALGDLAYAQAARSRAAAALRAHAPRAVVYSTTTATLRWPVPGAIRFDAPSAGNRPGRHGLWQRPVERRRLREAPLLLPWSEGGLAETPRPHADALVVPVPVEPSDASVATRDIAAITYATHPRKKGLDVVLAAWRRARKEDELLVVAGIDEPAARAALAETAEHESVAIPDGVRFAGTLAPVEYRALLRRARAFVTAPRREDYGIAQLEALADGCQLVTTVAPGPYAALPLARTLDPRLIEPGPSLAAAIRTALDDPRPDYAERAAELLAPFSPRAIDALVAERVLPSLID